MCHCNTKFCRILSVVNFDVVGLIQYFSSVSSVLTLSTSSAMIVERGYARRMAKFAWILVEIWMFQLFLSQPNSIIAVGYLENGISQQLLNLS